MNTDKFIRNIRLLCPTCGCSDFSYSDGVDETIQLMTCASCGRELNKDELLRENSESVEVNFSEIKEEVINNVTDQLRESLRKAFSGSDNIRLK